MMGSAQRGRWHVRGVKARRWAVALGAALSLAAPDARSQEGPTLAAAVAPQRWDVPPGADQGALALELASDGLWARVCAERSCAARAGRRLALPPEALPAVSRASFEALELAPGRRLAHVRIPLEGGAWEALIAAAIGSLEPNVIFAGTTGATSGEDGQREGDVIWVREGDVRERRVLLGREREDVSLCGRPTLLEPRLLGADMKLRPAKVQQLSLEERRGARILRAARLATPPTPGNNAVRALAASSAIGEPKFLTDDRPETSWAEARGGDGRGEFVVMRPVSTGRITALELLARPEGEAAPSGAAPRVFWLVTRASVYRVDWLEDAWREPGVWYRVQLPEPLEEGCLAVVLEQGHLDAPDSRVTLAELRAVTELQSVEVAELVGRLSTPGDAGAAAVPALRQAGEEGVRAVLGAFGALDEVGRARALDVFEDAPCELAAPALALLLSSAEARVQRRAERRAAACGDVLWPAMRDAFGGATGARGTLLADSIARVAPALAVELLGARLATAPPERAEYRDALSRAARDASSEAALRRLLAGGELGTTGDIEVARALTEHLPRLVPEASQNFARSAAAARGFEQRYLLLAPAARLAPVDPRAREFLLRALADPDADLRGAAARLAPDVPALHAPLIATTRDPGVRVRESGALRLGELGVRSAGPALLSLLSRDPWPRVRAAAARALVAMGPHPQIDGALVSALEDEAPSVRAVAVRALGRRGARSRLGDISERLEDEDEDAHVRAAAAHAVADLCATTELDALTRAARALAHRPSPEDVTLGSAALSALGRLAPPDLEQRLEPLVRSDRSPVIDRWLSLARNPPQRCSITSAPPRAEH